jgi:RND family efflux transporter MFP subunit
MMGIPRWVWAGVALLVVVSVVAIWRPWGDKRGNASGADVVAHAERRDIESYLLLTGEVTPAFQVEVKAEVGGKVKQLHVATGQFVKQGEMLVTIDDTDLLTEKSAAETDIEGARLAVEKNRGNYERAKALYEEKLISKEVFANLEADLAIAENTLEKSRSRLRTVEDRLSKTRILAPADGTVLDVLVNEGQVVVAAASVNAGTVLMNFADLSRLLINSHVNQVDAPQLAVGQTMQVEAPDGLEKSIRAKIEFIAPVAVVKNNIKGFEVQAVIEADEGRLKPGMSVSMTVPIRRADRAVAVPVTAVFTENKTSVVYVRKGDVITKRKVVVGVSDLSFAEIKSGLEEGEEILLIEPRNLPENS